MDELWSRLSRSLESSRDEFRTSITTPAPPSKALLSLGTWERHRCVSEGDLVLLESDLIEHFIHCERVIPRHGAGKPRIQEDFLFVSVFSMRGRKESEEREERNREDRETQSNNN